MKKRILLADDDAMFSSLLKFRLLKEGYIVNVVINGKEVKEYLKKYTPNLVICDIMMPYFSGIELVDYVKNELKLDIPFIVISSAGNEDNVRNAFELGANDFMSKPFNPAELLIRISKELNK